MPAEPALMLQAQMLLHWHVHNAGAPAAMRSAPTEEAESDELQSDAVAVPLRGQGGAATPVTDVDFLFSQNQSKLKALQVRSSQNMTCHYC